MMAAGDTHGGAAESEATAAATMETLALDDDRPSFLLASANYRSAMSSLSDANHPLAAAAAANPNDDDDDDPLRPASPPFAAAADSISSSNSLLDPPSYADVVFTPFPESNGGAPNGRSGAAPVSPASPSSSSERYIRISVSDPQKEAEVASSSLVPGGNTFVTYLVTTRTNSPDFGGGGTGVSEFAVRRRFRDVVALADRLAESYRGFFVPPRPDKSVVESQVMQKQEFVEQRRAALERYLARLAEHPVIGGSDDLKSFLISSGNLPSPASTTRAVTTDWTVKAGGESTVFGGNEVVQPAKGGRDLLRMFKELKQSVANDWGGAKPAVVEEDKEFLEKKEKIQDFEHQLSNASQQAETLVKAQQDIGETLGELGLTFIKLTKFENEEAIYNSQKIRATDTKCLATAAVKASRLYRELNAQTVKHLDVLHEYLGLMMAVHNAFSDRSSALLTVQTLLSELSSLHSKAEKLEAASSRVFGADRSRIRKIEELKETIKVTEDAKNVASREYERIKDNNRSELERLDRERRKDFHSMIKGFVINQAGYADKIADVWAQVASETSVYAKQSN